MTRITPESTGSPSSADTRVSGQVGTSRGRDRTAEAPGTARVAAFARFATLLALLLGAFAPPLLHAAPQVQTPGFYLTTIGSTVEEVQRDPYTPEGDFTGLFKATSFAFAKKTDALFVAEKDGRVRVIVDGKLQLRSVLDIGDQVATYIDRGIGGIDVHPDFPAVKEIVIAYTHENGVTDEQGPKYAKVARLALREEIGADGGVEYVADAPGPDDVILGKLSATARFPSCNDRPLGADCGAVDHGSHSFTFVRYAPDGTLFVGTGDGAGFYRPDPLAFYAQRLEHLSGKILRINPDGTGPADNPFFTGNPGDNASKVFAIGLRNPKSGSFDADTGEFCVGNVGWFLNEGVYCLAPGDNAGWPCRENGPARNGYETLFLERDGKRLGACPLRPGEWVEPEFAYPHQPSIIGGEELFLGAVIGCAVPDSDEYPADFNGSCVFGDYVFDTLSSVRLDDPDADPGANPSSVLRISGAGKPTDVATDPDGNVCYIAYETGIADGTPVSEIRCLRHDASGTVQRYPVASFGTIPDALSPLAINVNASASYHTGGQPLEYRWDFGDGSSAAGVEARHVYATHGDYTVTLEVRGRGESLGRSSSQVVRIVDPDLVTPVLPVVEGVEFASDEHFVSREVPFGVRIRNDRGDEAFRVLTNIYDEAGTEIAHLVESEAVQIDAGDTLTVPFVWPGTAGPGEYRMSVEFYATDWMSWNLKYPSVSRLVVRNRVSGEIDQDGAGRPDEDGGDGAGGNEGGGGDEPEVIADAGGGGGGGGSPHVVALLVMLLLASLRSGAAVARRGVGGRSQER